MIWRGGGAWCAARKACFSRAEKHLMAEYSNKWLAVKHCPGSPVPARPGITTQPKHAPAQLHFASNMNFSFNNSSPLRSSVFGFDTDPVFNHINKLHSTPTMS